MNIYNEFRLDQYIDDVWTELATWTLNESIKPDKNNVVVYTDKKGKIVIKINKKKVFTIENPVLKKGGCGVVCTVSGEDVIYNNPIKVVYTFKEFQN